MTPCRRTAYRQTQTPSTTRQMTPPDGDEGDGEGDGDAAVGVGDGALDGSGPAELLGWADAD